MKRSPVVYLNIYELLNRVNNEYSDFRLEKQIKRLRNSVILDNSKKKYRLPTINIIKNKVRYSDGLRIMAAYKVGIKELPVVFHGGWSYFIWRLKKYMFRSNNFIKF